MDGRLTLMAVHAHPDDEALFTGGVLARAADAGVRTVLVTCTNGELGYGPGGSLPGGPGHDGATVAEIRGRELQASCRILGVDRLERLGYHDSGMAGWTQNDAPGAFCQVPVAKAARRLAGLMERHRPDVVVTYGADGFYGHPDHVAAHRITVAAADATGIPAKVYFVAMPRSALARLVELAGHLGTELPGWVETAHAAGTDDHRISAFVDCSAVVDRKYGALGAHASQLDNAFFLHMGIDRYSQVFSTEAYVRGRDRTGASVPEDDLFAGVVPGGAGAAS